MKLIFTFVAAKFRQILSPSVILLRIDKRRLLSVRRDDPDVRLELPIDEDIFYKVFGSLGRLSKSRGRTVHRITENSQLDSILGTRWSVRIKNEMGDFEAVRIGSVEYYLYERPPISDFAPARGEIIPLPAGARTTVNF